MYFESRDQTPFIQDPSSYFSNEWKSWYHFLGVDITKFPKTKDDFISYCKIRNITSLNEFNEIDKYEMPFEPSEFYKDWTNWEQEMKLESDIW